MSFTSPVEDMTQEANRIRSQRAELRKALRSREVHLEEVLFPPPVWMETLLLVDLAMMVRASEVRGASLAKLGQKAVTDKINLMMPVGKASGRSRLWLCQNAYTSLPNAK